MSILNSKSIKIRFLVSGGSNFIRSTIGFVSGLLVARELGPASFGDLAFLLGSFSAILALLDMETSNAFFTFISRKPQRRTFFVIYFCWLAFQLVIALLFVVFIVPDSLFDRIWLGHGRDIVVLALLTTFMTQNVWLTVTHVGESMRKTVKIQLMNVCISMVYLLAVVVMMTLGMVSLTTIMLVTISQFGIAACIAYWVLEGNQIENSADSLSINKMFQEYWGYCKPLLILSLVVFLYNFTDKWLLQSYGGSIQQGYFQIANQFAAISLLATTSILKIFWKEIAEAWEVKDYIRVQTLYKKVNRWLVMIGAVISGLLIPWAEQIVMIFLGASYAPAWPIFALMLLYPIHQSMGQIGGTMFMARGQTRIHAILCIVTMLVSIPFTFWMIASPSDGGWGMGALGIAMKMVLLGVVSTNIQAWVIARYGGWKYDWKFQVVGIPLMIAAGYGAKALVGLIWDLNVFSIECLFLPVMIASLLYSVAVIWIVWIFPWLISMEKNEIRTILNVLYGRMKSLLLMFRKV